MRQRSYLGGRADIDVVLIDLSGSMNRPLLNRALITLLRAEPWTRVVVFAGEAAEASDVRLTGELPEIMAGSVLSKGI